MRLYLAVDISDDDVELQEVAEQCGYDLKHPAVLDRKRNPNHTFQA